VIAEQRSDIAETALPAASNLVEEPPVLIAQTAPPEATVELIAAAIEAPALQETSLSDEQSASKGVQPESMPVTAEPAGMVPSAGQTPFTIKAIEAVKAIDTGFAAAPMISPIEESEEIDPVRPWLAAAQTSIRPSPSGAERGQKTAASGRTEPKPASASRDMSLKIRSLPQPVLQALREKKIAEAKVDFSATQRSEAAARAKKKSAVESEQAAKAKAKLPLGSRLQLWLDPDRTTEEKPLDGRRNGTRSHVPGLVAYYYSGGTPRPYEIANISKTGFYMRTQQLWSPDTMVRMTLQREDVKRSVSVLARVVRIDEGGVGHAFVTSDVLEALRSRDILPSQGTNLAEVFELLSANAPPSKPKK
jgi:hypothetical protein